MKTWKEIYAEYKVAASKPMPGSEQYKRFRDKLKELGGAQWHIWDGCFDRLSTGSLVLEDTRYTFIVNGKKWPFWENVYSSDIRVIADHSFLEDCRSVMAKRFVKELGTFIMNETDAMGIETRTIRRMTEDIDEAVSKIDEDFAEDVRRRLVKADSLKHRELMMKDAMSNRETRPGGLWYQMLKAWADQEFFVVGGKFNNCFTIEKVTEKTIVVDGRRFNKDGVHLESKFKNAHPEIEKLH